MTAARLACLLGLFAFIAFAWVFSTHRRRFPWRVVTGGLLLQVTLGFLILRTQRGRATFNAIGDGFTRLLGFVEEGSGFLFRLGPDSSLLQSFAFGVLPTIVFFSSLMSVLYYLGIMQWVVRGMAWVMRFSLRTSGAETLAAAANVFVGHTEAPLVVRPYLKSMTTSELNALMTGGFATVTGGLLGAYAGMGIDIRHLLTASVISAPAALLIAKVMVPETEEQIATNSLEVVVEQRPVNLIAAAVEGASDGLKLALNVGAMLIAFLALIALLNWGIEQFGVLFWGILDRMGLSQGPHASWSLGAILGYVCSPLAMFMGVPISESITAGELIGLKTIANEFLAYKELGALPVGSEGAISPRTKIVLTYALAGFSNLGAIGIQVGGIGGLEPARRETLARLGLRAMFGGMLACCMTGAVAGLMLTDSDLEPESLIMDTNVSISEEQTSVPAPQILPEDSTPPSVDSMVPSGESVTPATQSPNETATQDE